MNILTFVDPSPKGNWALQLAKEFSPKLATRIVLLATEVHVRADPGLLDRAEEGLEAPAGLVVEKKVRAGRPRRVIVEEANAHPYEITIFPPAGRNSLQRLIHGSRIRTVVRKIPSSVLVARRPAPRIRRILAAISASAFGQTTVGAGLEIARALGAELTAIHVLSNIPIPAGGPPSQGDSKAGGDSRMAQLLEKAREEFRMHGLEPRILLRDGMVVEEVVHEVDAGAYDLLIVGHHIPQGADLHQDLAERIILWCPIPVLVVQPRKVKAGVAQGR